MWRGGEGRGGPGISEQEPPDALHKHVVALDKEKKKKNYSNLYVIVG